MIFQNPTIRIKNWACRDWSRCHSICQALEHILYSVQCTWMSGGETRPILLPLLQLLQATVGFYAEILISVWVGVPCIANTGSKQILMHISYLQQWCESGSEQIIRIMGDVLYADAYLAPVAYNRRKFADIRIRIRIASLDPHQWFTGTLMNGLITICSTYILKMLWRPQFLIPLLSYFSVNSTIWEA